MFKKPNPAEHFIEMDFNDSEEKAMLRYEENDNRYCVPAALSIITNIPVAGVVELIREEIGDQPIEGIFYPLALKILRNLGYTYKDTILLPKKGYVFVIFKKHVGVIKDLIYYDNKYPNGISLGSEGEYGRAERILEVVKNG